MFELEGMLNYFGDLWRVYCISMTAYVCDDFDFRDFKDGLRARFWSFATLLLTQFNTKIEKECWSNVFRLLSGKQKMSRANPSI